MPTLQIVKAANVDALPLPFRPVALFVGATSGIGQVHSLFHCVVSPTSLTTTYPIDMVRAQR